MRKHIHAILALALVAWGVYAISTVAPRDEVYTATVLLANHGGGR